MSGRYMTLSCLLFIPTKGADVGNIENYVKMYHDYVSNNSLAPGGFDYSLKLVNSYDKS